MSRELHENLNVEITDASLQDLIDTHISRKTLVVAPEDDRLTQLVPVRGQVTLAGDQLTFPDRTDHHISASLPEKHDERLPFETDAYDRIVLLFSLLGYFQRPAPFLECTRIVRGGGTTLCATGLQPDADPDHDAKWWAPTSAHTNYEGAYLLNTADFATPTVVTEFTGEPGEHDSETADAEGAVA